VGQLYQQWAFGFVSGVSFADPNHDPLSNVDVATIASWFEDYCRDNATAASWTQQLHSSARTNQQRTDRRSVLQGRQGTA
jgi:hypothetical protein